MTLVLDASTLVLAVTGETERAGRLRARLGHSDCRAPHLIDAEVGQTLRRHVLARTLTADEAAESLRRAARVVDGRHRMSGDIARLAWALRDNLSFYDALYVALAMMLDAPLWTADKRLAGAPGVDCEIVLVAA
jgi:predicted nucleic acid-binding protein